MPVALRVAPSEVELKPGESQAFEALGEDGKPVNGIKWSVIPRQSRK